MQSLFNIQGRDLQVFVIVVGLNNSNALNVARTLFDVAKQPATAKIATAVSQDPSVRSAVVSAGRNEQVELLFCFLVVASGGPHLVWLYDSCSKLISEMYKKFISANSTR